MVMSGKQGLWGRNDPMKSGTWRDFSLAAYDPAGLVVTEIGGNRGRSHLTDSIQRRYIE